MSRGKDHKEKWWWGAGRGCNKDSSCGLRRPFPTACYLQGKRLRSRWFSSLLQWQQPTPGCFSLDAAGEATLVNDVVRVDRISPVLLGSVKYTWFTPRRVNSSICCLLIFLTFSSSCSQAFLHHYQIRNAFLCFKLELKYSHQSRTLSLNYEVMQ